MSKFPNPNKCFNTEFYNTGDPKVKYKFETMVPPILQKNLRRWATGCFAILAPTLPSTSTESRCWGSPPKRILPIEEGLMLQDSSSDSFTSLTRYCRFPHYPRFV